jgi:Effector-associated domain 11
MNPNLLISKVTSLVGDDRIEKAIDELKLRDDLDTNQRDQVKRLESQLYTLNQKAAMGIVQVEECSLIRNTIRFDLLKLAQCIDQASATRKTPKKQRNKAPITGALRFWGQRLGKVAMLIGITLLR